MIKRICSPLICYLFLFIFIPSLKAKILCENLFFTPYYYLDLAEKMDFSNLEDLIIRKNRKIFSSDLLEAGEIYPSNQKLDMGSFTSGEYIYLIDVFDNIIISHRVPYHKGDQRILATHLSLYEKLEKYYLSLNKASPLIKAAGAFTFEDEKFFLTKFNNRSYVFQGEKIHLIFALNKLVNMGFKLSPNIKIEDYSSPEFKTEQIQSDPHFEHRKVAMAIKSVHLDANLKVKYYWFISVFNQILKEYPLETDPLAIDFIKFIGSSSSCHGELYVPYYLKYYDKMDICLYVNHLFQMMKESGFEVAIVEMEKIQKIDIRIYEEFFNQRLKELNLSPIPPPLYYEELEQD